MTGDKLQHPRVFLFLQGPNCGFFSGLARRLRSNGHTCLRINLCFADWFFWRAGGTTNYRGSQAHWPEFFRRYAMQHGVTDLLLLGEQRSYHKAAVQIASELGIQVTVTEWGYLRPDWITFEREGMSGKSVFPRDPVMIAELARAVPEPDFRRLFPDSFFRMALHGVFADCYNWILAFLYPGYRSHLLANPILLYISTGLRIRRARRNILETRKVIRRHKVGATENPFFLFPMQIEADFQIRAYSPYRDLEEALQVIVGSFARKAASHSRLLIKVHPLDPGLKNWSNIISEIALSAGVGERVAFIDGGAFEGLLPRCAGVVTVNSTAGIAALQAGCPVKTLGEAVYNIRGLVSECDLDEFWGAPCKPDPRLVADFVRALAGCIQIKGGFFSKAGLENAIEGATQRLLARKVNDPFRQLVDESLLSKNSKHKEKAGERIRKARAIVRGRS